MRRLLLAAAGGGATFAAPVGLTDEVVTLTSAPDGGGVISPDPRSFYSNGRTFFSWVDGSSGGVEVAHFDHATETASISNELADLVATPDTHDIPTLIVRDSDKKLVAAFCHHSGSSLFIRVSATAEETGGAWPAATNIDSSLGGTEYTYPSLVQLRDVTNDPIWLFYRDGVAGPVGRIACSKSIDDGATWAAQTVLYSNAKQFIPFRVGSDWQSRIDIAAGDDDPYTTSTSIYHFYIDGTDGSLHKSDGTTITAPLDPSDLTLVHDGAEGAAFCAGVTIVAGTTYILYFVKRDASTNDIRRARWTGSAWDVETIDTVGVHPADRYSTGLTIVFDDPDTVYAGDLVSGTVEVFRYTRSGGIWTRTQITSDSSAHNAQVQSVHFGAADLPVLWFQGTLTSSSSFSMATMGLRRT